MKKIIFVTGTDTGVGKTLLSSLLLFHLRHSGIHALAMKPFCSGGLGDIHQLQALQRGELSDAEMNPFYFKKPLAPLVAANKKNQAIRLPDVIERIYQINAKCDRLIVEGSGGILVPLGKNFNVLDLITALDCQVIITARNRLGTINHTMLTSNVLGISGFPKKDISVALMSLRKSDLSSRTNPRTLTQLLRPVTVLSLPFLGSSAGSSKNIPTNAKKMRSILKKLTQ